MEKISDKDIEENNKDEQMILDTFTRLRIRGITNTKEFSWKILYIEYENESENNKNSQDEKLDEKDEENNNNKNKKEEQLSQLINKTNKEMCKYGCGKFDTYKLEGEEECIICKSKKEIKYCDCYWYAVDKGNKNAKVCDYCYCSACRIRNAENIKKRIEMNDFKAAIIRKELLNNPCLEMDLLCEMKRRAAVDSLINDINQLQFQKRRQWCLLVMDLDFLKCWNDCLGHVKTDELIKRIGNIMKRNINDINNGKWVAKNNSINSLLSGFVFRTGGDEFVIAIKCGDEYDGGASFCPLAAFYNVMKLEINELGSKISELYSVREINEWKKAKEELLNAKDREGNSVDMKSVGISTGIYIPSPFEIIESDWLSLADKIALKHAKDINKPKKNGVGIYYEAIGGLINEKKVDACLEKGIANVL